MRSIGSYRVLKELARGGQGVVYEAEGPLGLVALKVLLEPHPDPRFLQEARAAARVKHRHAVRVHEFFQDDAGRACLVMELVRGESLQQRLAREGPLAPAEAHGLLAQLCEVVAHAHAQGVLHRDLKPHNVLVTPDGEVRLADFGLGKVVDQSRALTETGEILGTPAYMPPEQAAGRRDLLGPTADVYGLGATLYALLTGRPPFRAPSVVNLLHQVLSVDPAPPSTHAPGLSPAWDAVVLRCLAKDPRDRYPTVEALAEALAEARALVDAPNQREARSRVRFGLAAGLVVAGVVSAAGLLALRHAQAPPTTAAARPAPSARPTPASTAQELADWIRLGQQGALTRDDAQALIARLEPLPAEPDPDELAALAWARLAVNDARGARELGERARQAGIRDPWWLVVDARAFERLTALGQAIECYRLLQRLPELQVELQALAQRELDRLPPLVELLELGESHFQANRLPEAEAAWTRAHELSPQSLGPLERRAYVRAELGDAAGAERDIRRALELELTELQASELRVTLRELLPQLEETATSCLERGLALARRQQLAEALDCFDRGLRLEPRHVKLLTNRALVQVRLGEVRRGLEDFEAALELAPRDAQLLYNRAIALQELGELDEAEAAFGTMIERLPSERSAFNARSTLRLARGDLEGALDDTQRSLELEPGDPEALAFRGQLHARLGDYPAALADLNLALEATSEPTIHLTRANVRYQLEDLEGAILDLEQALDLPLDESLRAPVQRDLESWRRELAERR